MNDIHLFFDLLQVALGTRTELTSCPSDEEWALLYDMAKRQALVGIAFKGCERLPKEQGPLMKLFLKWSGAAIRLKEKNDEISQKCSEVAAKFKSEGFGACILKGQGNLINYSSNLSNYRTSGDIDVWVEPSSKQKYPHRSVIEYIQSVATEQFVNYIHVDFPAIRDTEIEVHIRPSFLCSPIRNNLLQKWFRNEGALRKNTINYFPNNRDSFPIPSPQFNAVYQLLHIYKHLFEEGIGLRQILDYYFVLRAQPPSIPPKGLPPSIPPKGGGLAPGFDKEEVMRTLSSFGMRKFAGAMMFVLQRVFAMDDVHLLCEPDEKEGQFLLNEIMMAGNFGKFDIRISHGGGQTKHAWEKLKHNFRLVRHYPEEVLWEPIFRLYHWIWRKLKLWRFE